MDLFDLFYLVALCFTPVIGFILFFNEEKSSRYTTPSWYYLAKRLLSINVIRRYQHQNKPAGNCKEIQPAKLTSEEEEDVHTIFGSDQKGNSIYIRFATRLNKHAEISMQIRLQNGDLLQLPGEPLICSMRKRAWSAGGLTIKCVEPFKLFRISYIGFIRCSARIEDLKFNFFWTAAGAPLFYPNDFESSLYSEAVSRETWRDGNWMRLLGDRVGYDQYGSLHGEISGSLLSEKKVLRIPTCRKRYWGTADKLSLYRDFGAFVATEEGLLVNVGARSVKHGCSHLRYGSVLYGDGTLRSIRSNDVSLQHIGEYKDVPPAFTVHLNTESSTLKCVFHTRHDKRSIENKETRGWELITLTADCIVNANRGRAFLMFWYNRKGEGSEVKLPQPLLKTIRLKALVDRLIVPLGDANCKIEELCGRKAAYLSLLKTMNTEQFAVSEGFVITTDSFKRHFEENDGQRFALIDVQFAVAKKDGDKELKSACNRAVDSITRETIDDAVSKSIYMELTKFKSAMEGDLQWAIRLSGDFNGRQLTAGNPSILNCKSVAEVLKAVATCWASLYTYENVIYRKSQGLPIRCYTAILVQVMLPNGPTGELFTCNPHNGNCSEVIVKTETLEELILSKDYEGIIKKKDGAATTNFNLILLGEIGVAIEKRFGHYCNIEWRFVENKLYLLQCKPITSLNAYSDYELQHELDDAILSEKGVYTTTNTNEIMPGALTVASNSVVRPMLHNGPEILIKGKINPRVNFALVSFSHHIFTDLLNTIWTVVPNKMDIRTAAADLVIFGRIATNEEIISRAVDKNGPITPFKILDIVREILFSMWNAKSSVKTAKRLSKSEIGFTKIMTLKEVHQAVVDFMDVSKQIGTMHVITSRANLIYEWLTFLILAGENSEFTADHYSDIALVLSSSNNIISANIPNLLDRISTEIRNSGQGEDFASQQPEEGVEWLKQNIPRAHSLFVKFINKHGHRSFREYELMEDCWSKMQHALIAILQKIWSVKSVARKYREMSVEQTINRLRTTRSKKLTILLEFVIKKCREVISCREQTKSQLIVAINKLRSGYGILAEKLVEEGRLPRTDLIFHLTKYELSRIVKELSPDIISKAIKREELYKNWDKNSFGEIIYGTPISGSLTEDNFECPSEVRGTPVCLGDVTARCCKVENLDDIEQLKPGDILIARSIDFRLSQLLPMVSGVVIELGGYISYGAVVAREYGLPCLVGAQNATKCFKTGDTVTLSGRNCSVVQFKE